MKKVLLTLILVLSLGVLAACGGSRQSSKRGEKEEKKNIKIGVTSWPYSDIVSKTIKPVL